MKIGLLLPLVLVAIGHAQTVAPNPGGALVVTNSTTAIIQYVDTPVTQRVDNYSTTITATVAGGVVFSQTLTVAYSDPSVQQAIAQADAILHGDGAAYGAPALSSTSTVLQSSTTVPPAPITCDQTENLLGGATLTGQQVTTTTTTFGPATIHVGACQEDIFIVIPGQTDINVNTENGYSVPRNVVTTNTYLTAQTYTITGTGATFSACDVNRDGSTNVADVQDIINEALGVSSSVNDLNGDSKVNVADVQIDINAALGLGCAADTPGVPFTVAGIGSPGYSGDGAMAIRAKLMNPAGIAVDREGNLYIADLGNNRIRKVAADGTISTIPVELDHPAGVAVDRAGNLYISDTGNNRILKIAIDGTISLVAASLNRPAGIAVDAAGDLYIAETGNHQIRKLTSDGSMSTVAGNGIAGNSDDSLYCPSSAALDEHGDLYIADSGNNRIRKLANGTITTVATELNHPNDVAVDQAGNLYIADSGNNRIRKLAVNGRISTVAGGLYTPSGIAMDAAGNLYIADTYHQLIRKLAVQDR